METIVVKHALKRKILERREEAGLGFIAVDFKPKLSYPMTEEEEKKDRRRREINKKSSEKCRRKQKQEYETNRKELQSLKLEQERLTAKEKILEEEKSDVLSRLRRIVPEAEINDALRSIASGSIADDQGVQSVQVVNCEKTEDSLNSTNSYLDLLESNETSVALSNNYIRENSEMVTVNYEELSSVESENVRSEILMYVQESSEEMSSDSSNGSAIIESNCYLSSDIPSSVGNNQVYVLAFG